MYRVGYEKMSQDTQNQDELEAPPLLPQLASCVVSIGFFVGTIFIANLIIPEEIGLLLLFLLFLLL